jgi:hypothetical protein
MKINYLPNVFLISLTILLTSCSYYSYDTNNNSSLEDTKITESPSNTKPSENVQDKLSEQSVPTATAAPKSTKNISEYFAFQPNTLYSYSGIGNEYASFSIYVDYLKDNKIQIRKSSSGTDTVEVYILEGDKVTRVFQKSEVYSKENFLEKSNVTEIILSGPLKLENNWAQSGSFSNTLTQIDTNITVNGKKYKVIEVTSLNKTSKIINYYAKKIGLVKSVFQDLATGSEVISELSSITPATPYTQYVNIYFPDFDSEKNAYTVQEMQLNTNESPISKIEAALKTPPENSSLTPTLSENVKLLGISFPNSNMVQVDITKNFIEDMNAGSSLEYLVISCLSNTLGDYYNKQLFNITVEGNIYSSGHMQIDATDYFQITKNNILPYKN